MHFNDSSVAPQAMSGILEATRSGELCEVKRLVVNPYVSIRSGAQLQLPVERDVGARLKERDDHGRTPMLLAALHGHLETLEW
jgi:ankyrin repeat protein